MICWIGKINIWLGLAWVNSCGYKKCLAKNQFPMSGLARMDIKNSSWGNPSSSCCIYIGLQWSLRMSNVSKLDASSFWKWVSFLVIYFCTQLGWEESFLKHMHICLSVWFHKLVWIPTVVLFLKIFCHQQRFVMTHETLFNTQNHL